MRGDTVSVFNDEPKLIIAVVGGAVVHAVAAAAPHSVDRPIAFAEFNGRGQRGCSLVDGRVGDQFVYFVAFVVVVGQVETIGFSLGNGERGSCHSSPEDEEGLCELHFELSEEECGSGVCADVEL